MTPRRLIIVVLTLFAFVVGALTGFASARITGGLLVSAGVVWLAFSTTTVGLDRVRRNRLLVTALGSLIPGLIVLLAALTYYGAMGLWYRFWTSTAFRVFSLTIVLAIPLWAEAAILSVSTREDWRWRVGGSIAAIGAGLIAMAALLPDWVHVVRFLDRPLNIVPATETMVFAVRTYLGVSLHVGVLPWVVGSCLLAGGYAIARQ